MYLFETIFEVVSKSDIFFHLELQLNDPEQPTTIASSPCIL